MYNQQQNGKAASNPTPTQPASGPKKPGPKRKNTQQQSNPNAKQPAFLPPNNMPTQNGIMPATPHQQQHYQVSAFFGGILQKSSF